MTLAQNAPSETKATYFTDGILAFKNTKSPGISAPFSLIVCFNMEFFISRSECFYSSRFDISFEFASQAEVPNLRFTKVQKEFIVVKGTAITPEYVALIQIKKLEPAGSITVIDIDSAELVFRYHPGLHMHVLYLGAYVFI